MKLFFMKLCNVILIVGILCSYQFYAIKRHQKVTAHEKKAAKYQKIIQKQKNKNQWKDGIYEGSGTGFGGEIKVRVVIKEHSIDKVEIVSAEQETEEYLESAKQILDKIVAAQSDQVDTVTGATLSSNGILTGVKDALEKAKDQDN